VGKNKIETSLFCFCSGSGVVCELVKNHGRNPPPKKDDTWKEEKSVCPRFDSVTVDAFCEERNDGGENKRPSIQ
jgi:hypothetical protein